MLSTLLVAFDLAGTFVFALSGALVAVRHRLDLFGILVLAFAAGNSGGIARDVMIGAIPPAAISDGRYVAASVLAGLVTFLWHPAVHRLRSTMLLFDAAGLGLFAVAGTGKALAFHSGPVAAALLGMLTGIGGGMVRDVLVREVPTVLHKELYAIAALAGAAVVVIGHTWSMRPGVAAAVGAVLCFCLRLLAIRHGWHLPIASPAVQNAPSERGYGEK